MEQEYKELLLKDLSARLPYGVKVATTNPAVEFGVISGISIERKISVGTKDADIVFECTEIKPYLRPISSMTEEEKKELGKISCEGNIEHKYGVFYRSQDYLNSIHVAYRTIDGKDMFELGLALEAPEGMYK